MKRSRNLTDRAISEIVLIIDGWSGPLAWNDVICKIEERSGHRYTRQALANHESIQRAFQNRKSASRSTGNDRRPDSASSELKSAWQRIDNLEAENDRLKFENAGLLEKFARWAYNASCKGLTEAILDRPLVEAQRGRTDDR